MSIYAGKWSNRVTEQDLKTVFTKCGTVDHVRSLTDRKTEHPRCFALVEMESKEPEAAGIKTLDGAEWMGGDLNVNTTKPREERVPFR